MAVAQRLRSSSSLAVVPEDGPQLKAHGTQRKVFFAQFWGEACQESILHKISSSILLFFHSFFPLLLNICCFDMIFKGSSLHSAKKKVHKKCGSILGIVLVTV